MRLLTPGENPLLRKKRWKAYVATVRPIVLRRRRVDHLSAEPPQMVPRPARPVVCPICWNVVGSPGCRAARRPVSSIEATQP